MSGRRCFLFWALLVPDLLDRLFGLPGLCKRRGNPIDVGRYACVRILGDEKRLVPIGWLVGWICRTASVAFFGAYPVIIFL